MKTQYCIPGILVLPIICGFVPFSLAGLMHPDISLQTYRDFAENRKPFTAGAVNVPVYYKDGTLSGFIPRIMSFESVVDEGFAALTGHPQFLASVAHNGGYQGASFTKRFGGKDHYRVVKKYNGWGSKTDYTFDIQVARLDKIVTEAAAVPYADDEELLANLKGKLVLRVGGGTQKVAIDKNQSKDISGAYAFLTGGTVRFSNVLVNPPTNNPDHPASRFKAFQFQYSLQLEKNPDLPLPICILGGDSGSPSWVYNENNKRWEYIGPGQSGGGGGFSQMRSSNLWSLETIRSCFDPTVKSTSDAPILWNAANNQGEGILKQNQASWNFHGLPVGKTFAQASMEDLEKTRHLVFSGTPTEIILQSPIDMGAGCLTFHTNMKLSQSAPANTLYSAGMDIKPGVTLTSTLTASPGQEWRKVGKGTLVIQGQGDNPSALNLGEGPTILARSQGKAASSILLVSGRPSLRLQGDNQLSGPVQFGARGGLLDLYGHSVAWNEIPHLDEGARITNLHNQANSVFTYTGNGTFLGTLTDGSDNGKGTLALVYDPQGQGEQAVWTWSGRILCKGGIQIKKGTVIVAGRPTPHAAGHIEPGDFIKSLVKTGSAPIVLHPGSTLTIRANSAVQANFVIMKGASLNVEQGAVWEGVATVQAGGNVNRSPEAGGNVIIRKQ